MSETTPSLIFVKKITGKESSIVRLIILSLVVVFLGFNYFKKSSIDDWKLLAAFFVMWLFFLIKFIVSTKNSGKARYQWQDTGIKIWQGNKEKIYNFKDFTKTWVEKHNNYDHLALLKRRPDEVDSDANIEKDLVMAVVNEEGSANVFYDEGLEAVIFSYLDKTSVVNLKIYLENKLKK